MIMLCKLEKIAFDYKGTIPTPAKDPDNPLLWRNITGDQTTNKRMEGVVVDIRSEEAYPFN